MKRYAMVSLIWLFLLDSTTTSAYAGGDKYPQVDKDGLKNGVSGQIQIGRGLTDHYSGLIQQIHGGSRYTRHRPHNFKGPGIHKRPHLQRPHLRHRDGFALQFNFGPSSKGFHSRHSFNDRRQFYFSDRFNDRRQFNHFNNRRRLNPDRHFNFGPDLGKDRRFEPGLQHFRSIR
jgi:hypothetical protein